MDNLKIFSEEKPPFVKERNNTRMSAQCLFIIDGQLYLGVYISDHVVISMGDGSEISCWADSIEISVYDHKEVHDAYQPTADYFCSGRCISSDDFDKHEIYWHNIDYLEALCNIDLLKQLGG